MVRGSLTAFDKEKIMALDPRDAYAPKSDDAPEPPPAPEIGTEMEDGTICAGNLYF